ncbi:MAG: MarR family transcriptional regulator [Gammaproteobacteria bacterium]
MAKRPAGRLQPPAAARRAVERRPEVSYLFGRMDRALRRRLSEALRPFKLSIAQYTTLSVLHTRGELSNAQLASRAFISPQAMNEVVQGLEERKLVSRRASASHGRIVQLLLTERGVEAMSACDAAVRQLELVMLAPLTALEKVTLRAALAKCTQILELHDGNGNAS